MTRLKMLKIVSVDSLSLSKLDEAVTILFYMSGVAISDLGWYTDLPILANIFCGFCQLLGPGYFS
jgi:hypothetical protein